MSCSTARSSPIRSKGERLTAVSHLATDSNGARRKLRPCSPSTKPRLQPELQMLATDRKAVRKRAVPSRQPSARILVATAGDGDSIGALHVAAELARTRPASVVALGIALPFPHTVPTLIAAKTPASIDEDGRTRVLAEMQATLAEIPGAHVWAKRAVVGWPADVINSAAAAWKASLVVLGLGHHG